MRAEALESIDCIRARPTVRASAGPIIKLSTIINVDLAMLALVAFGAHAEVRAGNC